MVIGLVKNEPMEAPIPPKAESTSLNPFLNESCISSDSICTSNAALSV